MAAYICHRICERSADDLVILIDAYKRHDSLIGGSGQNDFREEFGKLQVEINDEKSRTVDLEAEAVSALGFLGFDFRYLRSLRGRVAAALHAQAQKADGVDARAQRGVPPTPVAKLIERVINLINPVLRGWVNYFAVGHSSECFSFIKDWVEKKVRRQLAHACEAKGLRLGTME